MKDSILKKAAAAAAASAAALTAGTVAVGVQYFNTVVMRNGRKQLTNLSELPDDKLMEYAKINDEVREWLKEQELEKVCIRSIDNLTLRASVLMSKKQTDKFAVLFHGYRSRGLESMAQYAKIYYDMGFNVIIPDARAHGESDGKYIGMGVLDRFDCLRWVEYINGAYGKTSRIVLHGASMGASTVLMAAELFKDDDNVMAIVADSAFTNAWEVLSLELKKYFKIKFLPILQVADEICKRTAGYSFKDGDARKSLANSHIPVMLIHGSDDKLIPLQMTYDNYDLCAAEKKELFIAEGAGHVCAHYEHKDEYERRLKRFIDGCLQ